MGYSGGLSRRVDCTDWLAGQKGDGPVPLQQQGAAWLQQPSKAANAISRLQSSAPRTHLSTATRAAESSSRSRTI